jgi:hypothetical protein
VAPVEVPTERVDRDERNKFGRDIEPEERLDGQLDAGKELMGAAGTPCDGGSLLSV